MPLTFYLSNLTLSPRNFKKGTHSATITGFAWNLSNETNINFTIQLDNAGQLVTLVKNGQEVQMLSFTRKINQADTPVKFDIKLRVLKTVTSPTAVLMIVEGQNNVSNKYSRKKLFDVIP